MQSMSGAMAEYRQLLELCKSGDLEDLATVAEFLSQKLELNFGERKMLQTAIRELIKAHGIEPKS